MGVFTFVCRCSGNEWSAKQIAEGDIEASASSTFELQRKLVQSALCADSSGGVQSSFSYVTPSSAVFQLFDFVSHHETRTAVIYEGKYVDVAFDVVIGGGGGGAFFGGSNMLNER
ncbi:hypothetical protein SADUNF_Sadunf09G0024000 [Salix dunnii]|uniref:Uncharacterized protein n=1 Tax=Salix dunnii TaxID=1413687 RepID=A0A835JWG1_9ROSI|nr:hypothetical protein SADUNF_Sadunf09G0024000 [Salix dunnii]